MRLSLLLISLLIFIYCPAYSAGGASTMCKDRYLMLDEPKGDLVNARLSEIGLDPKKEPFVIRKLMDVRHNEQLKLNPMNQYHFLIPEIMKKPVTTMVSALAQRKKDLLRNSAPQPFIDRVVEVQEMAAQVIKDGYMYDESLILSYWFSLAISIPPSGELIDPDFDIGDFTIWRLREYLQTGTPKMTFKAIYSFDKHPEFGYYIPMYEDLTAFDLVKMAGAFFYPVGLVDHPLVADGNNHSPFRYMEHDLSQHASRNWIADAAALGFRRLESKYITELLTSHEEIFVFLNKLMADPDLPETFKNYLEVDFSRITYEHSTNIFFKQRYLESIFRYFFPVKEELLQFHFLYIDRPLGLLNDSATRNFAPSTTQKVLLKRLFKKYPLIKSYWQSKGQVITDPQVSRIFELYR